MIIDTKAKFVTFADGEAVSFDQLIKLAGGLKAAFGVSEELPFWEKELLAEPLKVWSFSLQSETTRNFYTVSVMSDTTWECTCPDFVERGKKETGETCKHIRRVQYPRR